MYPIVHQFHHAAPPVPSAGFTSVGLHSVRDLAVGQGRRAGGSLETVPGHRPKVSSGSALGPNPADKSNRMGNPLFGRRENPGRRR